MRILLLLLLGCAPSAYTRSVDIEGNEHFELRSTGGDGGGAGGYECEYECECECEGAVWVYDEFDGYRCTECPL